MNTNDVGKILHTEEVKKQHTNIERVIKRKLTELILLNSLGDDEHTLEGLSITKNFKIRPLDKNENGKFPINIASIKDGTLFNTEEQIQQEIFDLINRNIDDPIIAQQYKNGVSEFIKKDLLNLRVAYLKRNPIYKSFLQQHYPLSKNKKEVAKFNILAQIGKIMYNKLGEKAFSVKKNTKNEIEHIELSEECRNYFYTIFYNANQVRKERGKDLGQVFHDGDFPFIAQNIKAENEDYLEVIHYLISREKHNPHGKRENSGNIERAKKTAQYADILWALTNDQLNIAHSDILDSENPTFKWDMITNKLFTVGGGTLGNEILAHNEHHLQENEKKFKLTKRLKKLPSCVEKIIEGKSINDSIGFRISMEGVSENCFENIFQISKKRFERFTTSIKYHAQESYGLEEDEKTLSIKSVEIDNKGVLQSEEVDQLIARLEDIIPIQKRGKAPSPYISEQEWEEKMKKYYKEDVQNTERWQTFSAFYKKFAGGIRRGSNGDYKDFKFNITLGVYDEGGKELRTYPIEVQFDDINNNLGMANFHIRNCERSVNTQSNLSFDLSLEQVRKIVENNIKKMAYWAKGKDPKFSKIPLGNTSEIDISTFTSRTVENSSEIDKLIVEIINYFIKKGTFMLYCKAGNKECSKNMPPLENGLLTIPNLSNKEEKERIHICSGLEVAKQQFSYLENRGEDKIGIYDANTESILWAELGEIVDRINLGKKKDPTFSA